MQKIVLELYKTVSTFFSQTTHFYCNYYHLVILSNSKILLSIFFGPGLFLFEESLFRCFRDFFFLLFLECFERPLWWDLRFLWLCLRLLRWESSLVLDDSLQLEALDDDDDRGRRRSIDVWVVGSDVTDVRLWHSRSALFKESPLFEIHFEESFTWLWVSLRLPVYSVDKLTLRSSRITTSSSSWTDVSLLLFLLLSESFSLYDSSTCSLCNSDEHIWCFMSEGLWRSLWLII